MDYKEMTIEEKAKAYDEAINKAKSKIKNDKDHVLYENDILDIFPELKESEDVMIKEKIIATIHLYYGEPLEDEAKEMIAWLEKQVKNNIGISEVTKQELENNLHKALEKETPESLNKFLEEQGEQKPADKVEPKFKVGDWVVFDGWVCQIIDVTEDGYCNSEHGFILKGREDNMHLWTIQDAKDGDVIVNGSNIFIFSHLSDTRAMGYCHINLDDRRFYNDKGKNECFGLIDAVFTPATKEQRDLLFQKMHEAGFEWDADKKELKKIEQKPVEWSEEDEEIISVLNAYAEVAENDDCPLNAEKIRKAVGKLEFLRHQSQWRPSEEHLDALNNMRFAVQHFGPSASLAALDDLYNQLEKLTE